jgi:cytochrome P450
MVSDIVTVSHLLQARTAFENPHEWNPNRENLDVGFCFGAGVHACPGKSIALASMTSIVSTLLPRIAHIECVSPLMFDRPSLADREFCVVKLK